MGSAQGLVDGCLWWEKTQAGETIAPRQPLQAMRDCLPDDAGVVYR
jgi:hypothetical protein